MKLIMENVNKHHMVLVKIFYMLGESQPIRMIIPPIYRITGKLVRIAPCVKVLPTKALINHFEIGPFY